MCLLKSNQSTIKNEIKKYWRNTINCPKHIIIVRYGHNNIYEEKNKHKTLHLIDILNKSIYSFIPILKII